MASVIREENSGGPDVGSNGPSFGGDYTRPPPRQHQVQVSEEEKIGYEGFFCKDFPFAILFVLYTAMIIVFTVLYGKEASLEFWDDADADVVKYTAAISGLSLIPALVWTVLMALFGRFFIYISLVASAVFCVLGGVYYGLYLRDNVPEASSWWWWPIIVFSVIGLLILVLLCCIRKRVKFAAAILRTGVKATFKEPLLYVIGVIMLFVQYIYFVLFIYGTLGLQAHFEPGTGGVFGLWVGMIFGFIWAYSTLRGILRITVAGTVARWWKSPNPRSFGVFKTMRSFGRATTSYLGSSAFGSLFEALVETIHWIFRMLQGDAAASGNCFLWCLFCCINSALSCLEYFVKMFNRYAYSYIAIKRDRGYCRAGRDVFQMLDDRGVTAIANDYLIENVLFFGSIFSALFCAMLGSYFAKNDDFDDANSNAESSLGLLGFFIGFFGSQIYFAVPSGAATTVFIEWVENPYELSHQKEFNRLDKVWTATYPAQYEVIKSKVTPTSAGGTTGTTQSITQV